MYACYKIDMFIPQY